MNRPTIDKILKGLEEGREEGAELPSRYAAAMVTAKRARQINRYYHSLGEGVGFDGIAPPLITSGSKNYLTIAMEEVARGEIGYRLRRVE